MSDIEKRVKRILDISDTENGASFIDDFGADDLDITELLMALEDEFGIEFPDEEVEKITTVQGAIDYARAHVKTAGN
ncbi:hypothetical protein BGZ70_007774 [Mortierella alpina]|uniref:Acyl carrier protein n=1 Tax=Mortierella alpina TaxID=64518 RepID=A0A9P6J524_MORAP|nr:hypothetical protein BGZ70_007774 [Mortierella alpina]